MSYIGQTSINLNQRYREHIRYIRNNDPQSAYAQHILQNWHEYVSITDTMSLLKPIHKTSMLIPYDQLFIQTFHHNGNLITEQGTGEQSPFISVSHRHHAYVSNTGKLKQINTPPTTHLISSNFSTIATDNSTGTYIIHYSIELIAFSAEYTLFNNYNFNLVYRYSLSKINSFDYSVMFTRCCRCSCFLLLRMGGGNTRNM